MEYIPLFALAPTQLLRRTSSLVIQLARHSAGCRRAPPTRRDYTRSSSRARGLQAPMSFVDPSRVEALRRQNSSSKRVKTQPLHPDADLDWTTTTTTSTTTSSTTSPAVARTPPGDRPPRVPSSSDPFSFSHPEFPKDLVVAIAERTYMILPFSYKPWSIYHARIIGLERAPSQRDADPQTTRELREFKASYMRMLAYVRKDQLGSPLRKTKDACFIEYVDAIDPHRMILDCVDIDAALSSGFAQTVRTAIEGLQTTNTGERCIDGTPYRYLSQFIPRYRPYFCVEIYRRGVLTSRLVHLPDRPLQPRFAHELVLKVQAQSVPVETAAELSTQDDEYFRNEPKASKSLRLKSFLSEWKDFDWTVDLEGGEYEDEHSDR